MPVWYSPWEAFIQHVGWREEGRTRRLSPWGEWHGRIYETRRRLYTSRSVARTFLFGTRRERLSGSTDGTALHRRQGDATRLSLSRRAVPKELSGVI